LQARLTRELQRDLLRTRMVEFESLSERLYRVVRQAGQGNRQAGALDIVGGSIEVDRGVLDRMTPAFEHLLRNCVAHGIEDPAVREAERARTPPAPSSSSGFRRKATTSRWSSATTAPVWTWPASASGHPAGAAGRRAGPHAPGAANLIFMPGLLHGHHGDRAGRARDRHGRGPRRGERLGGRIETNS
jgi:hypothetical protein